MGLGVTILIAIIFFGVLGGMGFFVMKQLKKANEEIGNSTNKNIETAQEFLPFHDIKNGVIDMGGFNYVSVIECTSINYKLKTDKEKEIIELSFQRFLNSLTFPIIMYIQTKLLDNTRLLAEMGEEIEIIKDIYPQITEYANNYINEMSNLKFYTGNNKQKKKYIIVSYNEALTLGSLSAEEKHEYSLKEIQQRALVLVSSLSGVGIKSKILNTEGLIELVYSTFHKDNFGDYISIYDGEFFSLLVESKRNLEETLTNDNRADWILAETQTRIKNELLSKNIPEYLKKDYEEIIKGINNMRKKVGTEGGEI